MVAEVGCKSGVSVGGGSVDQGRWRHLLLVQIQRAHLAMVTETADEVNREARSECRDLACGWVAGGGITEAGLQHVTDWVARGGKQRHARVYQLV